MNSYFKRRGGGCAESSEMIGRKSVASRFNIDKFSEVLGLLCMERIVSKRYDFVVDALFHFKPLQRSEYRGDMFSFGGSRYCASKGVLQ